MKIGNFQGNLKGNRILGRKKAAKRPKKRRWDIPSEKLPESRILGNFEKHPMGLKRSWWIIADESGIQPQKRTIYKSKVWSKLGKIRKR